ncbi:MAG: hypothetical protein ABI743_09460, partial [bacterium]
MPSSTLPGAEVVWFLTFIGVFYGINAQFRRVWQLAPEGVWLVGFAALAITFYFRVHINLLLLTGLSLALLVLAAGLWAGSLRTQIGLTRELPVEVVAGK